MDNDTSVEMLYPLFMKIWAKNELQAERKKGYLSKLPLLSIPGKVFNKVLLNEFKDAVYPHLRDHQLRFRFGFRKNRSCADQIVTLRIILEQSLE